MFSKQFAVYLKLFTVSWGDFISERQGKFLNGFREVIYENWKIGD